LWATVSNTAARDALKGSQGLPARPRNADLGASSTHHPTDGSVKSYSLADLSEDRPRQSSGFHLWSKSKRIKSVGKTPEKFPRSSENRIFRAENYTRDPEMDIAVRNADSYP